MPTYSFNGDSISGSVAVGEPYAPITLVTTRFNETLAQAQEVYELLIGVDGAGGLLGAMESALSPAPTVTVTPPDVDTSIALETSGLTLPTFDDTTLVDVPTVEVDFSGITMPADVALSMTWAEATLPADVFTAVKAAVIADMADGSTGITQAVEEAIYTRARNRQQAENLAQYNRVSNTISGLQHALPYGVSTALLADFGVAQLRQEADLEAAIIEQQAKLAQDNRKAAIQFAVSLEQLLRNTRDGESARALDSAKSLATLVVQKYTADIDAFKAKWDGKKSEVQAKAENVRAAVDTNKGLVDVFIAEVQGFGEAEKAVGTRNEARVRTLEALISDADMRVRAQIGQANATVSAYQSESSIKERIASERAQIVNHCLIGMLSAVNASASLGYTGSETTSAGYHLQVGGNESHSYEHNPAT